MWQRRPSQHRGADGWQTDRQTERKAGVRTRGDRKEGRQRLTDKQTYRERKADKLTDTPDNQPSCGLISARSGTVGEDGQLIPSAIHTATNRKNRKGRDTCVRCFFISSADESKKNVC